LHHLNLNWRESKRIEEINVEHHSLLGRVLIHSLMLIGGVIKQAFAILPSAGLWANPDPSFLLWFAERWYSRQ
jgi:hypothetical protein